MIETVYLLSGEDEMDDEVPDIEDYYTKIAMEIHSSVDMMKNNITLN